MKEFAALVAFWILTSLFVAGAAVWLFVAAWKSSFPSKLAEDDLSPEGKRAMNEKLIELARKRAREVS